MRWRFSKWRSAERPATPSPREGASRRDVAGRRCRSFAGYAGLKNGELIRRATADRYDVLVTADRNMPAQQNIRAGGIAIVLVPGNRLSEIQPMAAAIQSAVVAARPGTVTRVGRSG